MISRSSLYSGFLHFLPGETFFFKFDLLQPYVGYCRFVDFSGTMLPHIVGTKALLLSMFCIPSVISLVDILYLTLLS